MFGVFDMMSMVNQLTAGDVNADGFDDLLVSAWGYIAGENTGKVYLVLGSR